MKKLLAISALAFVLTGCISADPVPVPVPLLKQPLCVTADLKHAPVGFSNAILTSLQKRGIRAYFAKPNELVNCSSVLRVSLRNNRAIIGRARLTVEQNKRIVGLAVYNKRQERVKLDLQSQTDVMINKLFR
ncbi:hypothetical protein ACLSZY_05965 [Avibacterium volantium]|uniref:hypothetical protein n=1 Tax=Avibacterium TaxID=292486 RepID=UPI0039FD3E5F